MKSVSTFLFVGALLVGAVACQDSTASASDPAAGDSAIVGQVLANTADVRDDRLVFPKAVVTSVLRDKIDAYNAALASGKTKQEVENVILMGDREEHAVDDSGAVKTTSKNPYGFIRRALSWHDEGDTTVVMTELASLDDAFQDLSEGNIVSVGATQSQGGVHPQFGIGGKLKKTIPIIDLSHQVIFANDTASLELARASLVLDTTVDVGADIGWFHLSSAHAILEASLSSEIEIDASVARAFSASPNKTIFESHWPIGSLGPIPITLGLKATIGCDISANGHLHATAGLHASTAMKAGIEYERDHGLNGIGQAPSFDVSVTPPSIDLAGTGSVRCYLRPQVSLLFFDAVGPTVTPEIYAKLDAAYPPLDLSLKGGFSVDVGGKLEILGRDLGSFDKRVFTAEHEFWHN